MKYRENCLSYDEYQKLRESVGWNNFSKQQTTAVLKHSIYTITMYEQNDIIGMGRLIGDGFYYTVVDIIVNPAFHGKGIGREIIYKLLEFVERSTPFGGRGSVQLIAEKGKEDFYEKLGFKKIPHEHCGSGMRKAVTAMARWASEQIGVKCVEAETNLEKKASQRVLEKSGFLPIGRMGAEGPRYVLKRETVLEDMKFI